MEYTLGRLAKLAGVSARTLRHYDGIGLLGPERISSGGYRIYGTRQVDLLQQILFYRALGMGLGEISAIVNDPAFCPKTALERHLTELERRRRDIDGMIESVKKTLAHLKGDLTMSDKEKFESFKRNMIEENERRYGAEARERYGSDAVDASNAKLMNMTREQYAAFQDVQEKLHAKLAEAVRTGEPGSAAAQEAAELHRRWLGFTWAEYSREAHLGLVQMYVDDPRFTAYYEQIAPGAAELLRGAVRIYCGQTE